jgi:hypothetical protein
MADPLSPATRAIKRNLLVASVLAISANAFNVSIDKIPVGGLSITFDDRLFAFLLVIVLVYFLCTFILYYLIDIKNIEATGHQEKVEETLKTRLDAFAARYSRKVLDDLQTLTAEYRIVLHHAFDGFLQRGAMSPAEKPYRIFTKSSPGSVEVPRTESMEDLYSKIEQRILYWTKRFPSDRLSDRRRALFPARAVRAMYFLRNYFLDGFFPIGLGVFGLIAILGHLNLSWMQDYLPSFKALSGQY